MNGTQPILCAPLLRAVDQALLELLRSLEPGQWDTPTIVPGWRVREVAAHLLDTALRKLSLVRDGCVVEKVNIRTPQDLAALVHRLNHEGVAVYRRLSPTLLINLLAYAGERSADFHESLDPFAPAQFPVSWAGESASMNWFDTARELTERWHHQQQIRLAVGRPGLMEPAIYHPVLDCFLRGLPHALRDVNRPRGTGAEMVIAGAAGGTWRVVREDAGWHFGNAAAIAARTTVPDELAWRLFTSGLDEETASSAILVEGDPELAASMLRLRAIVK